MLRLCLWLLLTALLAAVPRQAAQSQQQPASTPHQPAPVTQAPAQPAAPEKSPFGTLTPDQARAALDTLNDPKKRAAFTATLEALVHGQPAPEPPPPPPEPAPSATPTPPPAPAIAIQLAPDSLGAQVLLTASAFLSDAADALPRAFAEVQSVPLLFAWVVVMFTNPLGQHLVTDSAWRLFVTLILAEGLALALRYLLRRPMARVLAAGQRRSPSPVETEEDHEARAELGAVEAPIPQRNPPGSAARIGLGLARFGLRMVPVLGLLVAGHALVGSALGGPPSSRLVILAVIEAIALCQTLLALLALLFSPDPPGLRLFAIRRSAGAYLMRWGRRLILIAVPGYAVGEVALLLGLSPTAHAALQKVVGLALTICVAFIVVQRRRGVRRWLSAPPEATGVLPQLRNQLARYWYWLALLFLAAAWLSWLLRAPDAIARTLWYFMATIALVAVAALARLAVNGLLAPIRPAENAGDDPAAPARSIRTRLSSYHPVLRGLARLAINLIALLGLLQLYGLNGLSWLLTDDLGHRLVSGLGTLAVTIGLAFVVWEGVNIAIQNHLETLRREAQVARSARLRTLLPLIRTTLAITVAVVTALMVLSEIGLNIAPLLAGAGIVGVAIGFGSQRLVQDVITGVFLLLENTMQVGDVVKVGDQSGLVESLSVRTMRLRTEDASVVVIPFSAVTTVINMTRDYSRAVIAVNVAAGEDVDRVIDTLRAIVREMREEDAWSAVILDDLEVWGLDRFTDTALQVKCRIMCTPFGRWPVGREFNRRLKLRFDVVGIATPASALKLMPSEQVAAEAPVALAEPMPESPPSAA